MDDIYKDTDEVYNKLRMPETINRTNEDCVWRHIVGVSIVGIMYVWVLGILAASWLTTNSV